MKKLLFRFICLGAFTIVAFSCTSQKKRSSPAEGLSPASIDNNFKDAASQYEVLMKNLPPDRFPKTFYSATGKAETSGSEWWCSGFYPGTLLYLYEQTKDEKLYSEAQRILKSLEKEKNNK